MRVIAKLVDRDIVENSKLEMARSMVQQIRYLLLFYCSHVLVFFLLFFKPHSNALFIRLSPSLFQKINFKETSDAGMSWAAKFALGSMIILAVTSIFPSQTFGSTLVILNAYCFNMLAFVFIISSSKDDTVFTHIRDGLLKAFSTGSSAQEHWDNDRCNQFDKQIIEVLQRLTFRI